MAFFGVFGGEGGARSRFERRAEYLSSPTLHYSLDGKTALCYDGARTLEELDFPMPSLFVATAPRGDIKLGRITLATLYRRYGKHLRRYVSCPSSFALYDAKRGRLLLGGTHGEKCYIDETDGALFFSSDPTLLRAPTPIDFGILK
ncbi:MAG: hypothetical protein E7609_07810 [Ruminococcaceae bacterium]|nr:hypothetical protein [Oscillospiraceae bacterium]